MRNFLSIFALLFFINCSPKKSVATNDLPVQTNKLSDEYSFKIKEIISDSRCPEGVNCVWAGEVELVLSIFKKNAFYKEESLIISFKNLNENKFILEQYTLNKKIKNIEMLPVKKQGVEIKLDDYFLEIVFEN